MQRDQTRSLLVVSTEVARGNRDQSIACEDGAQLTHLASGKAQCDTPLLTHPPSVRPTQYDTPLLAPPPT